MHEKIKGGAESAWDQPGAYDAAEELKKDFANYVGGAAQMHYSLAKLCDKCTKAAKDPRLSGYAGLLKKIGDAHKAAHTNFTAAMGSALAGLAGVIGARDRSDPDDQLKHTYRTRVTQPPANSRPASATTTPALSAVRLPRSRTTSTAQKLVWQTCASR